MAIPKEESSSIYGMHDRGGEHLMVVDGQAKGWVLVTEEIRANSDDLSGNNYNEIADQGFGVIVRLNHAYGPDGTIPLSDNYQAFAKRVANFVNASPGAHIWIIGNEMNIEREQPRKPNSNEAEPITPRRYATCYHLCRDAIKQLPGHSNDQVIVGPIGPWNPETPYDADPEGAYPANKLPGAPSKYPYLGFFGDYIKYLHDILMAIGPVNCDGIAIHAYTHGDNPDFIFSDQKMGPPFDKYNYHFRTYQDQMNAIPPEFHHLPVYLTEMNQNDPWTDVNKGWIKNAYKEINDWNQANPQKIQAAILYRWASYDRWGIADKPAVQEDFREAIAVDYQVLSVNPDLSPLISTINGADNDQVTGEDQLGFEHYVTAFVNLIASPYTQPPLTIGIFGSWGMGKSFLLKHIKLRFETPASNDEIKVHVIDFNAWEYTANQMIWPGLVRKIMQELEKEISWRLSFDPRILSRIWRNLKGQALKVRPQLILVISTLVVAVGFALWLARGNISLAWTILTGLGIAGLTGLIKLVLDALTEPLSSWVTTIFQEDSPYGKPIDFMARIRADLELLDEKLGSHKRVLILIDDLDRCEPDKVVEVLQAINLLLNFKSFIICLGIDARIVTRAIEKHYKDLLGPAGASGYEYLDKIVQIPFRLPTPNPDEIKVFLSKQMGAPPPHPQPETVGNDLIPAERLLTQERNGVSISGPGPTSPTDSSDKPQIKEQNSEQPITPEIKYVAFTYDELKTFQDLARFLRANPRHLKRLLNVYRLVRTLAYAKKQQLIIDNPLATIRWLVISGQWPYTAYMMLQYYGEMLEDEAEGIQTKWPTINPLIYLFEQVQTILVPQQQTKLDHDLDLLRQLLYSDQGGLGWSDLKIIRQYTINFNPAVEAELRSELSPKPKMIPPDQHDVSATANTLEAIVNNPD